MIGDRAFSITIDFFKKLLYNIYIESKKKGTDELDVPVLKDIYIFDLKEEDEEWVDDFLSTADHLSEEEEEMLFNLEI